MFVESVSVFTRRLLQCGRLVVVGLGSGVLEGICGSVCLRLSAFEFVFVPFAENFVYFVVYDSLVYFEPRGTLFDVGCSDYLVGYDGNGFYDVAYHSGFFDRVVFCLVAHHINLELDEIYLVSLDIFDEIGSVVFACEAVGVVAVGQQHCLYIHTVFEQHIYSAYRCFDARCVAVVDDRDILCKTVYELYLSVGKRCARRGYDVFHSRLMHRNDVGVAFDEKTSVLLYYLVFGEKYTVQLVAFVVNLALGRIDVFRQLIVFLQNPTAEAYDLTRKRVYGKHNATAKPIGKRSLVVLEDQSRCHQILVCETAAVCFVVEVVVTIDRIPECEFCYNIVGEASFV